MKILTNLGRKVHKTERQLMKLNTILLNNDAAANPVPWTLITESEYTNKYADFLAVIEVYEQGQTLMQVHNQHKHALLKNLLSDLRKISQHIKVLSSDFYKELMLWGFEIMHSRAGLVKLPSSVENVKKLSYKVIEKHASDGVDSKLAIFDMPGFNTKLALWEQAVEEAEQARLSWRVVCTHKRDLRNELTAMMKTIGKEMLSNPNIDPRELELWGFEVVEFSDDSSDKSISA